MQIQHDNYKSSLKSSFWFHTSHSILYTANISIHLYIPFTYKLFNAFSKTVQLQACLY